MRIKASPRFALAFILMCMAALAEAKPARYDIDPEHFSIGFSIGHAGYENLLGLFLEGRGQFVYDEAANTLSSGRVEIAADSVFTNHDERDEHVRSEDFLAVENYPQIVFVARRYEATSECKGKLTGDLTLHGQTHPVTLDVTINKAARYPFGHERYTLGISAATTIRRSRWGMDYGVADNLVGDEVRLSFEFEAIRE